MINEEIRNEADRIWQYHENKSDEFIQQTWSVDLAVVSVLIARLSSTGLTGARFDALRDAARSVVETRLSKELTDTMERLDKSATCLSKVGVGLATVGVIIGVIQIGLAIYK
jgi:TRAP-type uncharacterized transport system fused permease subunit